MAQNYHTWPKNDARIYTLFPQIIFTEKAVPQTFSLLECMVFLSSLSWLHEVEDGLQISLHPGIGSGDLILR